MAFTLSPSTLPGTTDPSVILHLSQQAPTILRSPSSAPKKFPLSLFAPAETSETWYNYEHLLLACLKTGDERSAHLCLERLTARFGANNERIMGLRGLYQEAITEDQSALEVILDEYDRILDEDPVNMPIIKRRIALLRSMDRSAEAITSLVEFLEASPTDAEAWCELCDLYQSRGLSAQAIFSLEEALLITPNSWNLHARLGEIQYLSACGGGVDVYEKESLLLDSIKRFCRSIELCDDFIRGYYGLKLATSKLLQPQPSSLRKSVVSAEDIERLNGIATTKLNKIIQQRSSTANTSGNLQGDVIVAQELLDHREAQ